MWIFVMPALVGEAAAAAAKVDEERRKFEQINKDLEKIITEGKDQESWIVDTNVEGLPTYSGRARYAGWKRHWKKPEETKVDYLKRIFETFHIEKTEGQVTATARGLSLYFNSVEGDTIKENRKVVLFEPKFTNCEEITREMEVRTHQYLLKYTPPYSVDRIRQRICDLSPLKKAIYVSASTMIGSSLGIHLSKEYSTASLVFILSTMVSSTATCILLMGQSHIENAKSAAQRNLYQGVVYAQNG